MCSVLSKRALNSVMKKPSIHEHRLVEPDSSPRTAAEDLNAEARVEAHIAKDANQCGIEDENAAQDTPVKPIDTFWSKAHSLDTVNVPGISEVMAEVKKNWHSLPSWKACIEDSDASCGARLIRGRVLLLHQCEEVQSFRVCDLEKNNTQYLVEDVEVKATQLAENANATGLERKRAPFMSCRRNIDNIPQTTRRLFDTNMLESAAKRIQETRQNWGNTQGWCDSETVQKMEEVLVPIASRQTIEESSNSSPFKSPWGLQRQNDNPFDCESEREPWSPGLDVADFFGAGDDRRHRENVHEETLGCMRRLIERAATPY